MDGQGREGIIARRNPVLGCSRGLCSKPGPTTAHLLCSTSRTYTTIFSNTLPLLSSLDCSKKRRGYPRNSLPETLYMSAFSLASVPGPASLVSLPANIGSVEYLVHTMRYARSWTGVFQCVAERRAPK